MPRDAHAWSRQMKDASRCSELGVDGREMAALKFGVHDMPDWSVEPFVLSKIRLNPEDSVFMEEVIDARLAGRI